MRRRLVAYSALTLFGLGLTGCGLYPFESREPWRAQAEETCLARKLVQPSAYMSALSAIDGPGVCGMTHPFQVSAFAGGAVSLSRQATLACPVISRFETWLNEVVQPAAALYFGSPVVELRSGSYTCRPRNSRSGARLSEHAFGNAVDVMAFRFADGREIAVAKGWRGEDIEQDFLREVFVGACNHFTTVLGPGSDSFHSDHFHLDLARHDPRGQRHVCRPAVQFTPRLGAEPGQALKERPPAWRPAPPQAPIDAEEDPFEVSGRQSAPTGGLAHQGPRAPASRPVAGYGGLSTGSVTP
jgi:hypothetical protein